MEAEAQEAESALSSADTLPDDFSPESLGHLEGVRSLVAGHRKNVPALLGALKGSGSWKVRMAAGYALKEMGFQSLLVAAVDDSDPLVRTFARVVLGRPPVSPSAATPENTKSYVVDEAYRDRAAQLAHTPAALNLREKEQQSEAVVADLLVPEKVDPSLPYGSDPKYVAEMLALQDPAGICAGILKAVAGRDDTPLKLQALEVLGSLAIHSPKSRDAIYALSKDYLAAALADKDGRVRSFGLSSLVVLGPLDLRVDAVLRLTKDTDESVREAAATQALEVIRDLESTGNPEKADALLDQMVRFSGTKGALPDLAQTLAETKSRLDHEREFLYKGETVTTDKGSRIDRYLRVGPNLISVTPEEYDAAVARYGKPYVTETQFRELRAENNERIQKRNDEYGRREKPVRYLPGSQTAGPSGKAPEDRPGPTGEDRDTTSAKSPLSYRTIASLAILAFLGWLMFRILRRRP